MSEAAKKAEFLLIIAVSMLCKLVKEIMLAPRGRRKTYGYFSIF